MFGTRKMTENVSRTAEEQAARVADEMVKSTRLMTAGFLIFLGGLFILAAVRNAH